MSDIDDYILTRGEFAKKIGKSKNAVRLAMRRATIIYNNKTQNYSSN